MSDPHESFRDQRMLGFPPRSHHILLPERPANAARAALALYDATLHHQRLAASVGDVLLRLRLGPFLRVGRLPDMLDLEWWSHWCHEVARDIAGDAHSIGFRIWEDRVAGLLLDRSSRPLAFVKVWHLPPRLSPWHPELDLQAEAIAALAQPPPTTFRTPAVMHEGSFEGREYVAFEPLPPGRHQPLRPDPDHLHRIVDEVQQRLADMYRPGDVPAHHVMSHGDLTPRNLRVASDGAVWLFDWEYTRWAPPLADELRFWVTDGALRPRSSPEREGRRIAAILLQRGSRKDITEAVCWSDYITPPEAAIRAVVALEATRS